MIHIDALKAADNHDIGPLLGFARALRKAETTDRATPVLRQGSI
jgi:hypothetical protein